MISKRTGIGIIFSMALLAGAHAQSAHPANSVVLDSLEKYRSTDRRELHTCSHATLPCTDKVYEAVDVIMAKAKKRVDPQWLEKGFVTMELLIDSNGVVQCVELLASSFKDAEIENAYARTAKEWTFTPAKDQAGNPVCSYFFLKFDFTR